MNDSDKYILLLRDNLRITYANRAEEKQLRRKFYKKYPPLGFYVKSFFNTKVKEDKYVWDILDIIRFYDLTTIWVIELMVCTSILSRFSKRTRVPYSSNLFLYFELYFNDFTNRLYAIKDRMKNHILKVGTNLGLDFSELNKYMNKLDNSLMITKFRLNFSHNTRRVIPMLAVEKGFIEFHYSRTSEINRFKPHDFLKLIVETYDDATIVMKIMIKKCDKLIKNFGYDPTYDEKLRYELKNLFKHRKKTLKLLSMD